MHDLAEVMEKLEPMKKLKEDLLDCLKTEISKKGLECVDTAEAGEVVDMIKDLAEAEKACMETLYYQKVTEAMLSYEEPRYGYNANRSASTGRYISSGRGGRMGFMPHEPMMDRMDDDMWDGRDYMESAMMGYSDGQSGSGGNRGGSSGNSGGNRSMGYWPEQGGMDPRYSKAYNEYKMSRRHYTSTQSPEAKKEMSMHAEEHMNDTITTIKDIWKDADPSLKKRMKEGLLKLTNEMND